MFVLCDVRYNTDSEETCGADTGYCSGAIRH
jgi:hypothetical protein